LIDDDAKLAVARAQAEVALRQAEKDAAQRRWDHPIDRDRDVAVAAALLEETNAELKQLASGIAAEEAREKEVDDQLRRLLASGNTVSQQELQTTRFRLQAQQATLAAMKARQPVLEAQLRRHTAESKAATDHGDLRLEDKRQLDVAVATLKLAQAQLAE